MFQNLFWIFGGIFGWKKSDENSLKFQSNYSCRLHLLHLTSKWMGMLITLRRLEMKKGKQSAVEMAGRSAKRAAEIKPRCNDLMVALHCVCVCVTACVRVSFPRHFHSALSADDARERKLSPSSDHVSPFVKYSTRSCSGAKFPQNGGRKFEVLAV